jgi:hypothetical protein
VTTHFGKRGIKLALMTSFDKMRSKGEALLKTKKWRSHCVFGQVEASTLGCRSEATAIQRNYLKSYLKKVAEPLCFWTG